MFLILSFFVNILLFSALFYVLKQNRKNLLQFENIKLQNASLNSEVAVLEEKLLHKKNECDRYENIIHEISTKKENLEIKNIEIQANYHNLEKNLLLTQQKNQELESKNQRLSDDSQNSFRLSAKLDFENKSLQKQLEQKTKEINEIHLKEISELHIKSEKNFENIANKILHEKSEKFTQINQKNINQILEPLSINIDNFKKQVVETIDKDSKERVALQEHIKILFEQTNKISAEANNLASALKGSSKKIGNWGEMILETILQNSGLQKDVHYVREKSFNNEEGQNLRPDFQIYLPDDRLIITDSKVSLIAYNKFCDSKNDEESQKYLDEHLKSVKTHIDNLSQKKYDDLAKSLDFTIMFMPVEPAYLLAIQSDIGLWSFAYSKRILMVSPTNLIACLKIIDDLWKRELQSKNAVAIVNRAEKLYNKFVVSLDSIMEIGQKLNEAQKAYEKSINQMKEGKGNLIWQAENLKSLGLKSDKKINIEYENLGDDE